MSDKVSQDLVNKKCELIKSQHEEITVSKVRKLIGGKISIIDLVEKVTLYKENHKEAIKLAKSDNNIQKEVKSEDKLKKVINESLQEYSIDNQELERSLLNKLAKYVEQISLSKIIKLKKQQTDLSNVNSSLEISNLTLEQRYKELLKKYNSLKEESYNLKQSYNSQSVKYLQQEALEQTMLAWDDFKDLNGQFASLQNYPRVAAYDKNGTVVIKFPGTDFLTQVCRAGRSPYLKAQTIYDYQSKVWILSEFQDFTRTLDFLKKNRFVFSKELETVEYLQKQS